MSHIRSGWSTIGWWFGFIIDLLVAIWLVFAVLFLIFWVILSIAQPETVETILFWFDGLVTAAKLIAELVVLAFLVLLVIFIFDVLINFVINLFTPGVSSFRQLVNDLGYGWDFFVGMGHGIVDPIVDGYRRVKNGVKGAIDWVKSWFD